MSLTYIERLVPDFPALVSAFSDTELASPLRSTVPLLAYWQDPQPRLSDLTHRLGAPAESNYRFAFEYPVPVQGGRGTPSFTDLMIIGASTTIGIEAKFTEGRYESVAKWLRLAKDSNRSDVLSGWFQMIESVTGVRLDSDAVAKLPYQAIHRTASACSLTGSNRWVIYQVFSDHRLSYYRDFLGSIRRALGDTQALQFGILRTPPSCSVQYLGLRSRWEAGERHLFKEIRDGLLSGTLLTFDSVNFEKLDGQY